MSFQPLFILPSISLLNVWGLMKSGYSTMVTAKKDVFYTFLNNPLIHWRRIVTHFARQYLIIVKTKSVGNSGNKVSFMVLDDTRLSKTGKTMEFIGKVFDHCTHSYQLGMKVLTLGALDYGMAPVLYRLTFQYTTSRARMGFGEWAKAWLPDSSQRKGLMATL